MKVNFDNLREHIATSFNEVGSAIVDLQETYTCTTDTVAELIERYNKLHNDIWPLMCLYDNDGAFNNLSDKVKLKYIESEENTDDKN